MYLCDHMMDRKELKEANYHNKPQTPHEGPNLLVNGFELLQRLAAGDGVNQDEGVAFGDGEALHGGKLVTSCRVCDLQRADALITADHLQKHQTDDES